MERGFVVKEDVALTSGGNVKVNFPFTKAEYDNLASNSINKTISNSFDNITSLADISLYKFDASTGNQAIENNTPLDNCNKGTATVIPQFGSGNLEGSTPFALPQTIQSSSNYRFAAFEVSDFSEFHFQGKNKFDGTNGSPLPIELSSFTGNCIQGMTTIQWSTATETNVHHFEIQESTNGTEWSSTQTIDAAGNSSATQYYSTTIRPTEDITYYRLLTIDNDGSTSTHSPISVTCNANEDKWEIYPIPVVDQASVFVSSTKNETAVLKIIDLNGRVVQTQVIQIEAGNNQIDLDVKKLSQGTYFIIMEKTTLQPLKFIKM